MPPTPISAPTSYGAKTGVRGTGIGADDKRGELVDGGLRRRVSREASRTRSPERTGAATKARQICLSAGVPSRRAEPRYPPSQAANSFLEKCDNRPPQEDACIRQLRVWR